MPAKWAGTVPSLILLPSPESVVISFGCLVISSLCVLLLFSA